jgi:hypothetical protein
VRVAWEVFSGKAANPTGLAAASRTSYSQVQQRFGQH